jgi:hypothetical protein
MHHSLNFPLLFFGVSVRVLSQPTSQHPSSLNARYHTGCELHVSYSIGGGWQALGHCIQPRSMIIRSPGTGMHGRPTNAFLLLEDLACAEVAFSIHQRDNPQSVKQSPLRSQLYYPAAACFTQPWNTVNEIQVILYCALAITSYRPQYFYHHGSPSHNFNQPHTSHFTAPPHHLLSGAQHRGEFPSKKREGMRAETLTLKRGGAPPQPHFSGRRSTHPPTSQPPQQ